MSFTLGDIEAGRDERRPKTLLILAAGQGLALYLLHRAAEAGVWPATQLAVPRAPAPDAVRLDVTAGPDLEVALFPDGGQYELFVAESGVWRRRSTGFVGAPFITDSSELESALARGEFAAEAPELREVVIRDRRITLQPQPGRD